MSSGRIICLVGSHPWSRGWANEQEAGVEIWAANESGARLKPDRIFQIHPRNWREAERRFLNGGELPAGLDPDCFGRNRAHVEQLRTCGAPVYCRQVWEDIPGSVVYPHGRIAVVVGLYWLTSTWGYMMALALTEHVEGNRIQEIRLAGIELPVGSQRERLWEWPNLAFYLGMAMGLGIQIKLPPWGSSLMNAPLYAIDGPFLPNDPDHWWSPGGPMRLVDDGEGRLVLDRATGTYVD